MKNTATSKRVTLTAVCIALCYILPIAFHSVGLGSVFAPMHIPVLLCGMVCGSGCGMVCGAVGPLLSSALSGMPPANMLVSMVPELMVYGAVTGLMMKRVRTGKLYADLYIALGTAMLLGRVAGGIAKMLLYMGSGEAFTLTLWVSGYFVTSAPAIVCHLILVPALVVMLMRARLVPRRYEGVITHEKT